MVRLIVPLLMVHLSLVTSAESRVHRAALVMLAHLSSALPIHLRRARLLRKYQLQNVMHWSRYITVPMARVGSITRTGYRRILPVIGLVSPVLLERLLNSTSI